MTPEEGTIHKVRIGERYTKNVTVVETHQAAEKYYYLMREEQPFVDYLADNEENIEKEIIATNIQENGQMESARTVKNIIQSVLVLSIMMRTRLCSDSIQKMMQ